MDFETLKGIIAEILSVDEDKITPEANLQEDLEADSLDAMEINMAIEEACGKSLPDDRLAEIKTVGDILKLLEIEA